MRLSGNEITIVRGESFSIDRTIVNRDGSPYIVSNKLLNPNILITVADNSFLSKASKVYKYFLSLNELPRFILTNPIHLNETSPNGDVKEFPECHLDYSEREYLDSMSVSTEYGANGFIYPGVLCDIYFNGQYLYRGYFDGDLYFAFLDGERTVIVSMIYTPDSWDSDGDHGVWDVRAFYDESFETASIDGKLQFYAVGGELTFIDRYLSDGTIVKMAPFDALFTDGSEYKYWKPERLLPGESGEWIDYNLRFVKTFASTVTAEWEPKTYYYSIELVSGLNPQEGQYDDVTVILPPSKLNVLSNLRGGLK